MYLLLDLLYYIDLYASKILLFIERANTKTTNVILINNNIN